MPLSRLLNTLTRCLIQFSKYSCVMDNLCARSVGFTGCGGNPAPVVFMQKTSTGGWFDELHHSEKGDSSVSIEQAVSTALL